MFSFHFGAGVCSKVFLSRRIGLSLGLLFTACKRELLKSVIQDEQREEVGRIGKIREEEMS
jgi:hypothetical protein